MATSNHQSDLREVVRSLKDLKTCLCKLITVQKKQIDLELMRRKETEKSKDLIGKSKMNHKFEPQGLVHESAVDAPEPLYDSETTKFTSSDERIKRSHDQGSDFVEIDHDEFQKLMESGFKFNSDEELEKEFVDEHASNAEGAFAVNVAPVVEKSEIVASADRKTRETEVKATVTEVKETTPEAVVDKGSEESSAEAISSAEQLTSAYDKIEKDKAMSTVSKRHTGTASDLL